MLPGKEYSPADFARMAWRRRWLIIIPFVVCAFGALIVSSRLPNMYRSETLIQVVPQRVPDAYVQSTVTIRTEDRLKALSQLVMSRTELERLITTFGLYTEERAHMPMQDVVEHMRARASIEPVVSQPVVSQQNRPQEEADGFYIRFTDPEPKIATRVTERLGSLFMEQNARDRGALAEGTDDFLQSQLAEARKRLETQEHKLEQFREQHAGRLPSQLAFNIQAIQNTLVQQQTLVESLARDRDRKLMLERMYSDAQVEPVMPAPAAGAQPTEAVALGGVSTPEQLVLARAALARLELRMQSEHPDVILAKRLIEDLERKEAQEAAITTDMPEQLTRRERLQQIRAEIESLDPQIGFKEAEERRLQGVVADYQQRIVTAPSLESEWIALTRDYDTQQAAYKDLLSKSEQAKVAANLERRQVGEQFRILDPPRVPEKPISPNRPLIGAIGVLAGLFLGAALAAFMEFRDNTFHNEAEIVEVLGLPVVALVPSIELETDRRRRRYQRLLVSTSVGLAMALGGVLFWTMKLWRYVL